MKKPNKKGELKMEDEMDKDDDDFEFSDELKTNSSDSTFFIGSVSSHSGLSGKILLIEVIMRCFKSFLFLDCLTSSAVEFNNSE